jgi:hypothetical protein
MPENCHSSHATRTVLHRKRWRSAGAVLCLVGLTAPLGCSSSGRPPAPAGVEGGASGDDERNTGGAPEQTGDGGRGDGGFGDGGQARGGAVTGGYGGETSAAGEAGAVSDAGASTGAGFCGDSEVQDDEDCDPMASSSLSCADFGFDGGELACSGVCEIDTSACTGVEQCQATSRSLLNLERRFT